MKKLLFCILVFILISCAEKRKKHDLNSLEIDLSKNYSEIFDSAQTYLKTHEGKFPIMVYKNQLNGKQLIFSENNMVMTLRIIASIKFYVILRNSTQKFY